MGQASCLRPSQIEPGTRFALSVGAVAGLSCGHYGLAPQFILAQRHVSWSPLDSLGCFLEYHWVVRKRGVFLPVSGPMVCDGKEEAGCCSFALLVVEPCWFAAPACVCHFLRQTLRRHLRIRLQLDSLHPKFDHSPPLQGGTLELPAMRQELSAAIEFLSELRRAAGGDYFLVLGAVGAAGAAGAPGALAGCGTIPYFLRIGWKSGCVLP